MKILPPVSLLASVLFACAVVASHSQPYTIGTYIGSPTNPGSADGTNAAAQFTSPTGLTRDTQSNLFLLDGNAIRKITTSGTNRAVSTLAGTILLHSFSDGTNAAARFNYPQGVAVDSSGNLYVADTYNNAIRKAALTGTNWVVATIAGPAPPLNPSGSSDGTNFAARFNDPYGIAVDSADNLYVADSLNHTIRKITPVGTNWVVTTIAGLATFSGSTDGSNSVARFKTPVSVAVGAGGVLYVADFANQTIRKVTPFGTNWAVTTIAGSPGLSGTADGLGNSARFNLPQSIAVDGLQNLFVTDSANNTIRKITPAGLVSTLAGSPGVAGSVDGTGTAARFNQPYGIVVDASGLLYIADYLGYSIRQGHLAALLNCTVVGQQCVLSWPGGLTGFLPESSTSMPASSWVFLPTNGMVLSEQYFYLTNGASLPRAFYRLHQQTP